jgi:hypothetical protein
MWWLAGLCFLPPVLCGLLFVLELWLLERGILNKEDLSVAVGRRGTLGQELLNVWTWEAAIGVSCVLSFLAVPVGILILVTAKWWTDPGATGEL